MARKGKIVPVADVKQRILLIRGQKVILDADLASFYDVPTKRLNEQVKRNCGRFPDDFVFRLTKQEKAEVVANCDHLSRIKFSPSLPFGFTEHGALMAASVLNSERAIEVSLFIVRAFVLLREEIVQHLELARRLVEIERKLGEHDEQLAALIGGLRQILSPDLVPSERRIGF